VTKASLLALMPSSQFLPVRWSQEHYYYESPTLEGSKDTFMTMLCPFIAHSHRWSRLHLQFGDEDIPLLSSFAPCLPSLRVVQLEGSLDHLLSERFRFLSRAPKLNTVILAGSPPLQSWDFSSSSAGTVNSIISTPAFRQDSENSVFILANFPSLEILDLSHDLGRVSSSLAWGQIVRHRQLKWLGISIRGASALDQLRLPALKHLSVVIKSRAEVRPVQ
jgi:hypothetical protein